VPHSHAERLIEQRIAVRAGDRGPLARERQRDLLVGMVAVARRDEVLATHGQHRPAEPLGAKEPAPPELPDLRLPLTPQVVVALDRRARRRNEPSAHNTYPFWRTTAGRSRQPTYPDHDHRRPHPAAAEATVAYAQPRSDAALRGRGSERAAVGPQKRAAAVRPASGCSAAWGYEQSARRCCLSARLSHKSAASGRGLFPGDRFVSAPSQTPLERLMGARASGAARRGGLMRQPPADAGAGRAPIRAGGRVLLVRSGRLGHCANRSRSREEQSGSSGALAIRTRRLPAW
jgi:hypothetical protein